MSDKIVQLSDASFEADVIKADGAVLVDFWAEWCGPCKMLAPVLDEVAGEKGDSVKVVKVNVDEEGDLAVQYGIRSIPALYFFKDGELKHKGIGVQSKSEIIKRLESLA